uniref:Ig-like domain-containing protein n=1 Tax=Naja naja TaxID=35670 RepID=A0A8C6Y1V6_NAJNA
LDPVLSGATPPILEDCYPTSQTQFLQPFIMWFSLQLVIEPVPNVHEGQRVSLTCEDANFQPSALYTWYKDARWLAEGSATSFLFRAVTPQDMGSYSCQAQDERGIRMSPPTGPGLCGPLTKVGGEG